MIATRELTAPRKVDHTEYKVNAGSFRRVLRARGITSLELVVLLLEVGTVLAVWFSGRMRDWSVMTDELLHTKPRDLDRQHRLAVADRDGRSIAVHNQGATSSLPSS